MNTKDINYVYSGRFDTAFLNELYGNDVQAATEVFESSLQHITIELKSAPTHFHNSDIQSLRKLYHKIKPLFGYVGLSPVQDLVQEFETKCERAASMEELRNDYEELNILISEAIQVIRQELIRMKTFLNVRA